MMRPTVRVDGVLLPGPVGIASLTHRLQGAYEAVLSIPTTKRYRPPALVKGAPVDISVGGLPRWPGSVTEIDREQGQVTCEGAVREAEGAVCLTAAGLTTSNPRTAATNAIAQGWVDWIDASILPSADFAAAETESVNYLNTLLDAWATEQSVTWGIDAYRRVFTAPIVTKPKTVDWLVLPQAGVLGVSSEALAGTLVGRWRDSNGELSTTIVGTGRPVQAVDMTEMGPLTAARATAKLNGILAQSGAVNGWTNGVTISPAQIMSPGGVHPHPALVRAGQSARMLAQVDTRGMALAIDVILGETVWNVADNTLTLNPVDTAARDLASIIEQAGGQAA